MTHAFTLDRTWRKTLDYEIQTGQKSSLTETPMIEVGAVRVRVRRTWKEKILDYEIETNPNRHIPTVALNLKRKDSRLRDWNQTPVAPRAWWTRHLKRKDSRLRDWNSHSHYSVCSPYRLEKKRFSITRLKHMRRVSLAPNLLCLKRKDSRLRDWNPIPSALLWSSTSLEKKRFSITRLKQYYAFSKVTAISLEKKRFSITRLKQSDHLFSCAAAVFLEKKRFSITRLKPLREAIPLRSNPSTWKEKILDYEIETDRILYEAYCKETSNLKRKDSRLRDWNSTCCKHRTFRKVLEKKRFSITRLKRLWKHTW